jgi:uncharacterized membrane protein
MSKFFLGNLFLGSSILLSSIAQIILKSLMTEVDEAQSLMDKVQQLLAASRVWRVGLVGMLVGSGFLAWVISLSKLDLSYAYPIACGSALLVTVLSVLFLGEAATPKMWLGTVLITIGTALLAPSS